MTVRQLMENADPDELALWAAVYREEAEQQYRSDLAARAEAALARR